MIEIALEAHTKSPCVKTVQKLRRSFSEVMLLLLATLELLRLILKGSRAGVDRNGFFVDKMDGRSGFPLSLT
jgi:hypothetical protein